MANIGHSYPIIFGRVNSKQSLSPLLLLIKQLFWLALSGTRTRAIAVPLPLGTFPDETSSIVGHYMASNHHQQELHDTTSLLMHCNCMNSLRGNVMGDMD